MRIERMPEGLQFMELTLEKAVELWKRMNAINGLFDDFKKDNFEAFKASIGSPYSLWLELTDGNGVVYMLDIVKGLSATAHFLFWDKKLRGKEELCKQALKFAMANIPLVKVNVFLPDYANRLGNFVRRVGLLREGKIRRWSISNGRLFDVYVYGITYEEVIEDGRFFHTAAPTVAGQGIQSDGTGLLQQSEHPTIDTTIVAVPGDAAINQPDAAVDRSVRPDDREDVDGSNGRNGTAKHRRSDEPVSTEARD